MQLESFGLVLYNFHCVNKYYYYYVVVDIVWLLRIWLKMISTYENTTYTSRIGFWHSLINDLPPMYESPAMQNGQSCDN